MTLNIKISNPLIDDLELTYLSQDITNTTSVPVISSDFFVSPDDLILIGNDKYDNAEIRQIATISGNTITLSIAAKNDHITGERIRKLVFNQMKIYKKTISAPDYTLLTTATISYNHPQGLTLYTDTIGINTDLYKVKYFNSVTSDESDLSSAFSGGDVEAGSVYLSISEFRNMTGVSDTEVNDGILNELLARSTRDLKRSAFAWGREQLIEKTTYNSDSRYYFPFSNYKSGNMLGYLTDWNLDGNVNTSDITVYEMNSNNFIRNDITTQVSVLSTDLGYFKLNTGYPTDSGYKVYVTYAWMNFDITQDDTQFDVKRYLMHKTMCYIVEWYRNQIRRGITKQTLGGLTVEKNLFAWTTLYDYHSEKANEFINRFKPLLWGKSGDQSVWLGGGGQYSGYGNYYGTGYYDNRNPW